MPRRARLTIAEVPHHVTQRGNNQQDVFFTDDDCRAYLSILKSQSAKYGLEILGWCLMTNHVHLIARPAAAESLAQAVGRTGFIYTQHINRLHGRSGHLWQNRFYSCPLGREHFWQALRYVEQNPLRAGLAQQAWKYPWSSAVGHIEGKDRTGLLDLDYWRKISATVDWRKALEVAQPEELIEQIRSSTHTGRPLATDSFLSKLETLLNKRLRPAPPGRPKTRDKTGDSHPISGRAEAKTGGCP